MQEVCHETETCDLTVEKHTCCTARKRDQENKIRVNEMSERRAIKSSTIARVSSILLAVATSCRATTQYHDFLLKDGRSFRGRIVAYDQHADTVSIECADKSLAKISPTVFDDADQLRIEEWNIVRCFESENLFKISAGRDSFEEKEAVKTFYLGDGGPQTKTVRVHHVFYTIHLKNNSTIALQNLAIECCIFYSQEHRGKSTDNKWVTDRGIQSWKAGIHQMDPKSKRELKTKDIITNKVEDLQTNSFLTYGLSKEVNVEGIWLRIILPLSNGREIMREYCLPDSLSKHHDWVSTSVPAGLNR